MDPRQIGSTRTARRIAIALLAFTLIALVLRLIFPHRSPMGLQIDEASNAWNAWCILHTLSDEHRQLLPWFYTEAFGDFRSPLFLYFLIPFQWLFGLGEFTTRLPAIFTGAACVPLLFYIGRRLFSVPVGLIAAALLAVDPWHLQQSRWGHEATSTPFLALAAIALILRAARPSSDPLHPPHALRPWPSLLAGLAAGLACYGYAAIRIYLPILLLLAALATCRHWWPLAKRRPFAAALLAAGFALLFIPLLKVHLTDPNINTRARGSWVWEPADAPSTRLAKAANRYLPHFSPSFLFRRGALDVVQKPPNGFGQIHWFMLPLLLAGVLAIVPRLKNSPAARFLAVAVLLYPAGDLLIRDANGPSALRSLPGAWSLLLLAAVGAHWLWRFRPAPGFSSALRWSVTGLFLAVTLASISLHLCRFYGPYNDEPALWAKRNVDLQQAIAWLKGQWADVDMVVCEGGQGFLYAPVLVYLRYDPESWFAGETYRGHVQASGYENMNLCLRFGKMNMLLDWSLVQPVMKQELPRHRPGRVVFILRPGDIPPPAQGGPPQPLLEIHAPDGTITLRVYDYLIFPEAK